MEEEQEAGRLSPCSELLQHALFEEKLVGEGGECTEDTKDAKKAGIKSKEVSQAQKQA